LWGRGGEVDVPDFKVELESEVDPGDAGDVREGGGVFPGGVDERGVSGGREGVR